MNMLERYALFKALETVFKNPQKKFSVRGLGKEAGFSPGSAMACFNYMKEKKLVKVAKVGRAFQFHADLENPLTREWKKLFALDSLERVWDGMLKQLGPGTVAVLLYGSMAKGIGDEKSDLDLLVVTNKKKRVSLSDIEAKLKREINLTMYTPGEWREKAKKDKVFYEQVILDAIILFGEKPVVL
ncbi:MAG: nucleotidyltransferase domain-containing protein [Candidatus Diapherotrites archaeon]|nr:nucleotidyltransferase domain-containing protein [Candidatus Diapherotrites archaeon]